MSNLACRIFKEQLDLLLSLPNQEEAKTVLYQAVINSFNQFENQFENQNENQNENAYVSVSVSELSKSILNLLSKNIVWKEFSNNYGGKRERAGRPKKPYAKPNGKPYDKPRENLPENEDENENKDKKYGELKNVRLTESQYKELSEKYNNLNLAIEKLDTWLGTSGSKNKNKNHYAYFKSNSWVWENLQEKPDAFDLYTQLDKRKREETSRLAKAAERTMEELRKKAEEKWKKY